MFEAAKNLKDSEKLMLCGAAAFYTIVTILSLQLPFFSDGIVQSSMAAQWFFDNNFQYFFFPEEQNPGHPPFWGMYLAMWWKIFGRELWVGHLAMLPFLIGIAWNYLLIVKYFLKDKAILVAMIFLLLEPTLLSMSTQVSPDIPLVFLFLLALRALLYNNYTLQILGMAFMPLLNTRGVLLIVVIFIIEVARRYILNENKFTKKTIIKYVVVAGVMGLWLVAHYLEKGWIGFNRENMPWKEAFEPVSVLGYIRNWGILGWRFIDFGRLSLWVGIIIASSVFIKRKIQLTRKGWFLLFVIISQVLIFGPVITRYVGTLQHRYLIPAFVLLPIGLIYMSEICLSNTFKKTMYILISFCLIAGHFLIYPDKISQGWEASLAHLPYFELRERMTNYVEENRLDPNQIPTGSPNKYRMMDTDLKMVSWKYPDHTEVDIRSFPYVIYSNISNDFPDDEYDLLHREWKEIVSYQKRNISIKLFRNPKIAQ